MSNWTSTMDWRTMKDAVSDLRDFSANPQQRIRTGFDSIDYYIEGPAAGEVCTFIGRSYTGKSLVATQIMANHADKGSIFFSLEMPRRQALARLFSQYSDIPAERVRNMISTNMIDPRIDDMASTMEKHVIVDQSGMSVTDMMVAVEQYAEYFGEMPLFVQIDYLERIGGIKSEAGGWAATEAAADQVKDLAKHHDIPVFLYHQTNRSEPEHEPPTEKSARGGGYTEADFVVGMWAPGRDPKMPPFRREELSNIIRMNVLKNRHSGQQNQPWKPLEFERMPSLRLVDRTMEDQQFKTSYDQHVGELSARDPHQDDVDDFGFDEDTSAATLLGLHQ